MISCVQYVVFCNISFELLILMFPQKYLDHRCIIKLGFVEFRQTIECRFTLKLVCDTIGCIFQHDRYSVCAF